MNRRFQFQAVVAAALISSLAPISANAMCGATPNQDPAAYQHAVQAFQAMQADRQAQAPHTALSAHLASNFSMAGFWHTIFLIDPKGGYSTAGPNVFDEGFDAWHDDGTETLNDITPPPAGNVCLGVWTQTGPQTYILKHPSWGYDETNTKLTGIGTFIERVTLDPSGNSFTGTFILDAVDLHNTPGFHLEGALIGQRIVADAQPFKATPAPAGPSITAVVKASSLATSNSSVTLDGSASSGDGKLTYLYSLVSGGKFATIVQTPDSPIATVQFISGPGNYIVQLKVTDSAGNSATSEPISLAYSGN